METIQKQTEELIGVTVLDAVNTKHYQKNAYKHCLKLERKRKFIAAHMGH